MYIFKVIQCYIQWVDQSLPVPKIQLVYFNRINISAGGSVQHDFDVAWENWAYWDGNQWTVQTGKRSGCFSLDMSCDK